MGLVRGEDVLLSVPVGATYKPIGCARSITFNVENDLIETSITGSGRYRTYVPGALSFSGTLEGLVFLCDDTDTKAGLIQMYNLIDDFTQFHFRYFMTDGTINYERRGDFLIESINETSSFDNMATFTVNFRGTEGISTIIT